MIAILTHNFGKNIQAKLLLGSSVWDRFGNIQAQWVGNSVGAINGAGILGGDGLQGIGYPGPQGQTNGLTLPNLYNISYSYGIPKYITMFRTQG